MGKNPTSKWSPRRGAKAPSKLKTQAKAADVKPVEIQAKEDETAMKDLLDRIVHPKKRALLQALRKSLGNVSQALRAMEAEFGPDVTPHRNTHLHWMLNDADYRAVVQEIEERDLDFAESMLRQRMRGVTVQKETKNGPAVFEVPPDVTAIMFYLNNRGAKRGYGNRVEVKHSGKIGTGNVLKPKSLDKSDAT